jgi:hypothetical protein
MRKLIVVLVMMLLWLSSIPDKVYACSGGSYTHLNVALQHAEIVVTGRFVELDEKYLNGVFEVQQYLAGGEGPRYLLLALHPTPYIAKRVHQRRHTGDCTPILRPLSTLDTYVMPLVRNTDGSYYASFIGSFERDFYRFSSPDQRIEVSLSPYNKKDDITERIELNLYELVGQIHLLTGEEAVFPTKNVSYPLTAPILLTTESSGSYLLPVALSTPVMLTEEDANRLKRVSNCPQSPCKLYSPNGLDEIEIHPERQTPEQKVYNTRRYYGQSGVISPTSDTMAIWDGNQIIVYAFFYPLFGYTNFNDPREQIVNTRLLNTSNNPHMVWSPDGRMLAYTDERGLWLWDVFTPESEPALLVLASDDKPITLNFSPMGRYLQISEGGARYNLDTVSRKRFPDGMISNNDRLLLAFDTDTSKPSEVMMIILTKGIEVESPLKVHHVHRMNTQEFLASYYMKGGCGEEGCIPEMDVISKLSWYMSIVEVQSPIYDTYIRGYQFDYDPYADSIVSLIDAHTIGINGVEYDLSQQIADKITKVEWLPSLFYHEN